MQTFTRSLNAILFSFGTFAICSIAGCASAARDVGKSATPAVVQSGLHEANTPDSQAQIQHLLDSPAIQKTGQSIGEGVGIGLFDEATRLSVGEAIGNAESDAGSSTPTSGPTSQPTSAPANGASPAAKTPGGAAVMGIAGRGGLNGFVKSSVQEAFLAATDPQFKVGERAMSESIGEGFVEGMITVLNKEGPALSDTIRKQLGPIIQEIIREQIAPAVRDMLREQLAPLVLQVWKEGAVETLKLTVRPDLQPDVIQNAQNASVGASRGTHQAMIESGFLSPSGDLSPRVQSYLWIAVIAVGVIVAAILSLLLLLNLLVLHHWRHRHETTGAAAP